MGFRLPGQCAPYQRLAAKETFPEWPVCCSTQCADGVPDLCLSLILPGLVLALLELCRGSAA